MKKSQILQLAWGTLRTNDFVCHAIERVAGDTPQTRGLIQWIQDDLLQGHETLEQWLMDVKRITRPEKHYLDPVMAAKMLVTRQAWVEWMISYWEAEGQ
jgi:hypothetical protein